MEKKGIKMPKNITEYFIDNKYNKRMTKIFDEIKNDIANHELMFKKVERSEELTKVEEDTFKSDTFIVTKFRNITCTDFNGHEKIITDIISVKEESLSELNKKRTEIEKKYIGADNFHWYDYCTLTISYWFRAKYIYKIDEWDYHLIGNKEIKHQKSTTKFIMV